MNVRAWNRLKSHFLRMWGQFKKWLLKESHQNLFFLKLLLYRSLGSTMLILGGRGTYHARRSKGQRVKKIISANIDARNMKFGQKWVFLTWKNESVINKSLLPLSAPKTSKMMFLEANFTIFCFSRYHESIFIFNFFFIVPG